MRATHIVTFYGGNREEVRILVDRTEMRTYTTTYRYGSMLIESEETDILGNHARWIHFGLYNATDIKPLNENATAKCHQGLKLPVE